MLAVLIEKLPIDTLVYVHFGNIYGDSRRGRIVKVSMIVFEQFGHENNNAVSESAKTLEV
jgi:hypothetical protein